ncbi:zinc metalloproteinase nas-4-like isoform X2 [Orbicella faveolata]|uniref:zinc metalloproteinase nas-4-like isoform X2 n=1 Tax=Orbicella faveolata TaxID=48498 RepID=UPI0009E1D325|nr:zinc metalloproteinase nas-4-like isoform X2 [Orbicella faveolata]
MFGRLLMRAFVVQLTNPARYNCLNSSRTRARQKGIAQTDCLSEMNTLLSSVLTSLVIAIFLAFPSNVAGAPRQRTVNDHDEVIEGDILVTEPLRNVLKAGNSRAKRDIVSDMVKRWPDGVVPYKLDSSLNKEAFKAIRKAIREFHKRTCVKFVPHTDEHDFVEFQGNYGCFSAIGRQGGKQRISVGEGCEYKGTVMHEMMHALGFFHEQSRTDRDNYIMVLWWNIEPGFEQNFDSYGPDRVDSAEEPYDFDSLMHYDNQAFSKNGDNTLQSISDPNRPLGNMDDLSVIDIKQLLKYYPCKPWDKKPPINGDTKKDKSEERKCQDVFKRNCKYFASHNGYCTHWMSFMKKYCPYSCGFCKTAAPDKRLNIWKGETHTK